MKKYDTRDKEAVEEALSDEQLAEQQLTEDVLAILQTPAGKRFFKEMFSHGHMEEAFFRGNSSDAYNLGVHNFAVRYWNLCKSADPGLFYQIIMEIEND